ncbi:MAG: hypothetical protein RIC55_13940 [Pirellulaceae bacterium]
MRPIFLYTGVRTGTMFIRRLLETHSAVDFCVLEDLRVDRGRKRGYQLTPPIGSAGVIAPGEAPFSALNTEWLCGRRNTDDLLAYYRHWKHHLRTAGGKATPYEALRQDGVRAIRDLFGLEAEEKSSPRLFFHDHLRAVHAKSDYRCLQSMDVVTTIRHPLLTAISIRLLTGEDRALWEFWDALERYFETPGVIFAPVDRGVDHHHLLERLGLPPEKNFSLAVKADPAINALTERPMRHQMHERHPDPELKHARRLLVEENRLHPRLRPYWDALRQYRFLSLYESFAYDFHWRGEKVSAAPAAAPTQRS